MWGGLGKLYKQTSVSFYSFLESFDHDIVMTLQNLYFFHLKLLHVILYYLLIFLNNGEQIMWFFRTGLL